LFKCQALAFVVSDSICHGDRELIERGFVLAASVHEGLRLDGQDRVRQTWERDVEILTQHQHVVGGKKVTTHFERL
jgi:hypothetical protein